MVSIFSVLFVVVVVEFLLFSKEEKQTCVRVCVLPKKDERHFYEAGGLLK